MPPRANEPPDWDALARLAAGECTESEARELNAWLAAHPDDAAMFAALGDVVASSPLTAPVRADGPDVDAALKSVRERMAERSREPVVSPLPVISPTPRRAAPAMHGPAFRPIARWVVGGLAAAALTGLLLGRDRGADAGAARTQAVASRGAPGSTIETAVGVRDSVLLPDGTRVILAPASRLTVSQDFGGTTREVTLEGEAWLSVHHDAAKPFTVRAGAALVRDIGTEFSVRTDQLDAGSTVAVVVTEGIVALSAVAGSDSGVTLAIGDRGELRPNGQVIAQRGAASADDVAWTRGSLRYRAASLEHVRADLRRWYGIELRTVDSTLAARRLTASFDGQSLDETLRTLALALGADVERSGNVALLRRAGTSP